MTEENNIIYPIKEKEILSDNVNKVSIPNNIRKNLILPNLKNNYITSSSNNDTIRDKKKILNKSSSYKNLKERDLKAYNEKFKNSILNNSTRLLNNNKAFKIKGLPINIISQSMSNPSNKIRNNLLLNKIKQYKKALFNGQISKDSKNNLNETTNINATKNSNTNDENTKDTKSTIFKTSQLNLNKFPITKILIEQKNKNKSKNLIISHVPKYSKFFYQSKNKNISSQTVYKYYIDKSASEITLPVKNYDRLFDSKKKTVQEKLKRIYCENKNFDLILQELKDHRKLAYKDDFVIEEYQNTLLEILDKRVSQKNLINLQEDYRELNKKIFNVFEPKGRFTFLAEKLKYSLPSFLIEKLKQLDKDSIISRMNYYNKFKEFRKDNKLKAKFGKKDENVNKTKNKDETKNKGETKNKHEIKNKNN